MSQDVAEKSRKVASVTLGALLLAALAGLAVLVSDDKKRRKTKR